MSAAELAAAARALAGELRRRRRWGHGTTPAGSPAPAPAPAPRRPAAEPRPAERPTSQPSQQAPAPAPTRPAARPGGAGGAPRSIPKPTVRRGDLPAAGPAALDLDGLRRAVSNCMACKLSAGAAGSGALIGRGAPRPRILYVTDFPGPAERSYGKVLAPELGAMMLKMSQALGTEASQIHLTSAVKCPLPGGALPRPIEVDSCRAWLLRELELLQPQTIVGFGAAAARALLGPAADLEALRGQLLHVNGVPTVLTQPPRDMQADPSLKKRAWAELKLLGPALGVRFD